MDTAALVAVVGVFGAVAGALIEWARKRGQDNADINRTHIENSGEIVDRFRALLDEETGFLREQIAELRRERDEDRTEIERLRGRMERLETRLAAERKERAAAEALAAEIDAELHAANQFIDVLVSLLQHHGLEVPSRPDPIHPEETP